MIPDRPTDSIGLREDLPEHFYRTLADKKGKALLVTRNNLALYNQLQRDGSHLTWAVLTKEDFRGRGLRHVIRELRKQHWSVVIIEDLNLEVERRRDLYILILLMARAQSRWIVSSGNGPITAEFLSVSHGLTQLLRDAAAELFASAKAILSGYSWVWRMRGAKTGGAFVPEPSSCVAMVKTQFWFGVQAGGSVSHVRGVASGMRALGLHPKLWTTSRIPGIDPELPQEEVAPAKRPRIFEDAAMAGFNDTFIQKASRGIAALRPALIYQRHDVFNMCGLILARRLGIPLVLEVNASEVWARQAWSRLFLKDLARRMERVAFRNADRLVVISQELVPTVLSLGGSVDRIVVNPNGVDVLRFVPDLDTTRAKRELGFSSDWVLCGFLGTFARWHGVLFLAEEIPRLVNIDSRLRFLFIGEGDLRPEVEDRVTKAGVRDRVIFKGLIASEQVPLHLAACDILLSPHLPFEDGTEFFGSPTKLFEYMAAGRAIVASRLGSIARILDHGETGVLIDPGDGEALRAAILDLANRPDERQRLGQNARAEAERSYTWEANVRRALQGIIPLPASEEG